MSGYLLASNPMLGENNLDAIREILNRKSVFTTAFYVTLGESETHATKQHEELTSLFASGRNKGIRYHYNLSANHNHQTTPLDSFTAGLNWYFSDFPDITFHSLAELDSFGGIEALQAYFIKRGQRYGLSQAVGAQAKFSIFRHAAQENNWETFQRLETAIGQYEVNEAASAYWYHFFGHFFQQHDSTRAEALYLKGLAMHPSSHKLWAGLAATQAKHGQKEKAIEHYKKALTFTEQTTDDAKQYQRQISALSQP